MNTITDASKRNAEKRIRQIPVAASYKQSVTFDFAVPQSYTWLTTMAEIRTRLNRPNLETYNTMITVMNEGRQWNGAQILDVQWQGDTAVIMFNGAVSGDIRITYVVSIIDE